MIKSPTINTDPQNLSRLNIWVFSRLRVSATKGLVGYENTRLSSLKWSMKFYRSSGAPDDF
jgi:hypothetical protein